MKNIIALILISFLFAMCQNKNNLIEQTQSKNDSLQQVINKKDSSLYTFLNTFNTIENNLQTIKDKEGIISTIAADNTESFKNREAQINDDINIIYSLMIENKKAIIELQKKLKDYNSNEKRLNQIIALLNQKLLDKDAEIIALGTELKKINIQVVKLNYSIDTLLIENNTNKELLKIQDQTIKTAFYIIGTNKELKDLNIIDNKGIFSNKEINSEFDKGRFTQINIIEDTIIKLNCKKLDLITTHPQSSYTIIKKENIESLVINDPWEFWSVSKYLVISIK